MLLQAEGGAKPREETAKSGARSDTCIFKFNLLLVGRFPTENSHRNTIRATQITLHLLLKISKGVETQIIVKAFLIVSVASLDLAVMPRRSRTDKLMLNLVVSAEHVKRMCTLGFGEMGKFCSVVSLNRFWRITEEDNSAFYKVYGRIAAVFLVSIDKTLS